MVFCSGFDDLLVEPFPGVRKGEPGENLRVDLKTRLARPLP